MGQLACLLLIAMLILLLLSAGIEDARARNIANWKTAAIALAAPLWWWASGVAPWPGVAWQIGVAAITFGLFAAAFAFGQMGGGDVKLIGALALWLPAMLLVETLMVMSLVGGALTLAMLADRKWRRQAGPVEIPYGIAIAIAGMLAVRQPIINQF